jgi:hypothetical protein
MNTFEESFLPNIPLANACALTSVLSESVNWNCKIIIDQALELQF